MKNFRAYLFHDLDKIRAVNLLNFPAEILPLISPDNAQKPQRF